MFSFGELLVGVTQMTLITRAWSEDGGYHKDVGYEEGRYEDEDYVDGGYGVGRYVYIDGNFL